MTNILETIDKNYRTKLNTAHSNDNFSAAEWYLDEKIDWEANIKKVLTKTLTLEEYNYIQTLDKFFEIENALLTEPNLEDRQEREWQLEMAKNDMIIDTRRYLISNKNNKLPIFNMIDGEKFREMTDLLFEEDYITNGIFDEELRLERNYFIEDAEEQEWEAASEENNTNQNEETSSRRSWEVTATVHSPFLNSIRWDIKEKYNIERSEIAINIKKNIEKFADIFKDKPKIFISVFAERYTQEECKTIVERLYPKIYYTQSLENYINDRYKEENN